MEIKKCPFCGGIGELTMDEKIEEMAERIESELKVYFGAGDVVAPEDFPYQARGIAESLSKKGYRKESDTAREILMEIKQLCIKNGTLYLHDWVALCKKYGVDLGGQNE